MTDLNNMKRKHKRNLNQRANTRKAKRISYYSKQRALEDMAAGKLTAAVIMMKLAIRIAELRKACKVKDIEIEPIEDRIFTQEEYDLIKSVILSRE